MHAALTFGPERLHAFLVAPGRAGEARRLADALAQTAPLTVAALVAPGHALALRQSLAGARAETPFDAHLVASEVARRHHGEDVDPFLAAAKHARSADVPFVPLLPAAKAPGFFARRRLRRAAEAAPTGLDEAATSRAIELAIRGDARVESERRAADLAAARALGELLFARGASRVAAVLPIGRADRVLDGVRALSPSPARSEVTAPEVYPAYR